MNGFVYKWTNSVNDKWYIGSHQGATDDGYLASGRLITKAFAKYGVESFTREILYEGQDFRAKETALLEEQDATNNSQSYNLKNTGDGGSGKGHKKSESARENIRKAKLGKNNPMYGKAPWNKGLPQSKEQRRAHSKRMKGRTVWNVGIIPEEITCPHCDKTGKGSVMHRWHFNRCKEITKV